MPACTNIPPHLLPNGKVLVAGGYFSTSYVFERTFLYDPEADSWSETGAMSAGKYLHTATLLLNGKVLVTGGNWWYGRAV